MDEKTKPPSRGAATREALIDAATLAFAREGFGPANLREIAQAAKVNPALIGYHFGSKEGLYAAVFERLTAQIRVALEPALVSMEEALAATDPAAGKDRYLQPLLALVEGMLTHMVHEHPAWGELIVQELQAPTAAFDLLFRGMMQRAHGLLARVLVRLRPNGEQQAPGPAYDLLYEGVIQRNLRNMTGLLQKLRPKDDPDWIRLLAVAITSQVLSIRHYRATFLRTLQWECVGERELEALKTMIRRNTTLLILGE